MTFRKSVALFAACAGLYLGCASHAASDTGEIANWYYGFGVSTGFSIPGRGRQIPSSLSVFSGFERGSAAFIHGFEFSVSSDMSPHVARRIREAWGQSYQIRLGRSEYPSLDVIDRVTTRIDRVMFEPMLSYRVGKPVGSGTVYVKGGAGLSLVNRKTTVDDSKSQYCYMSRSHYSTYLQTMRWCTASRAGEIAQKTRTMLMPALSLSAGYEFRASEASRIRFEGGVSKAFGGPSPVRIRAGLSFIRDF